MAAAAALAAACATAPYTQRHQLILLSPKEEQKLGATAFQDVLQKSDVTHDPALVVPVTEVGRRIAAVANQPDYRWQFAVIDDDVPNAFALPGGYVAVYTGIFPIARTTAGLAVVMGHEIAHAIARHGAERASQAMVAQTGSAVLGAAVGSGTASQAVMAAYGLGAQYGLLLPWSRTQESEADHIGLILMAKAGYDPREAIDFWERMRQASDREAIEFLSTHPGHGTREQQIRDWLPDALQYYQRAQKAPVATLPPAVAAKSG
ncbi:MAG TPA: M48 family metallopeptidase [Candidatus Binatia bacterium]|nr:M48 family metallopeptidase [Candidatus Binatia bacterium]